MPAHQRTNVQLSTAHADPCSTHLCSLGPLVRGSLHHWLRVGLIKGNCLPPSLPPCVACSTARQHCAELSSQHNMQQAGWDAEVGSKVHSKQASNTLGVEQQAPQSRHSRQQHSRAGSSAAGSSTAEQAQQVHPVRWTQCNQTTTAGAAGAPRALQPHFSAPISFMPFQSLTSHHFSYHCRSQNKRAAGSGCGYKWTAQLGRHDALAAVAGAYGQATQGQQSGRRVHPARHHQTLCKPCQVATNPPPQPTHCSPARRPSRRSRAPRSSGTNSRVHPPPPQTAVPSCLQVGRAGGGCRWQETCLDRQMGSGEADAV